MQNIRKWIPKEVLSKLSLRKELQKLSDSIDIRQKNGDTQFKKPIRKVTEKSWSKTVKRIHAATQPHA